VADLYNEKPDLSHIRTIGSTAYAPKPENKRRKLADTKATKCILICYEGSKIYRLLTPSGTILRSSNVHVQEKTPAVCPKNMEDTETTKTTHKCGARNDSADGPSKKKLRCTDFVGVSTSVTGDGSNSEPPTNSPNYNARIETNGMSTNNITSNNTRLVGDKMFSSAQGPTKSKPTMITRSASKGVTLLAFLSQANTPEPSEPLTYAAALSGPQSKLCEQGMVEENDSLKQNRTWTLVPRPQTRRVLRGKWVYKLKRGAKNEILRYKARWVVKGFEQKEGLDYNETFATVVKPMIYKALFAIAVALDLEVQQMDVVTAFLYGTIDKEIYVEQPTGLDDGTACVCRLNRALYGLKQAPRVWYTTLANYLKNLGFAPLVSDLSVFQRDELFCAIYVDDLLLVGNSTSVIQGVKDKLSERFNMKDLGACKFYLGMEVMRDRANRTIRLSQRSYVEKVLRDFRMWDCRPITTPMDTNKLSYAPDNFEASPESRVAYQSAVGSLMYAMLGTRPNLAYAVSFVSRFASNLTDDHLTAVKWIFRYLKGTSTMSLVYQGVIKRLSGYSDADWAGIYTTRRSTSGYVFNIGSAAISWASKRQPTVALSTCEAEYSAQTQATKEALWLRGLLEQMDSQFSGKYPTVIYCDNQGSIALAKNPEYHARTKHFDIQLHWIREKVKEGRVQLEWIPTSEQLADELTEPLSRDRFEAFRKLLGLEVCP
jgi:hypothetical protein